MKNQPAFNEWQLYQITNYTHLQNTIVPLFYLAINCKSNITQHTLYPGFITFEFHASGNYSRTHLWSWAVWRFKAVGS